MSEFCENCPLEASFDAAEDLLQKTENSHASTSAREKALGGVEFHRKLARRIIDRIGCEGPVMNDDGHKMCPNSKSLFMARDYYVGPTNNEVKPEVFSPNKDGKDHLDSGQYL